MIVPLAPETVEFGNAMQHRATPPRHLVKAHRKRVMSKMQVQSSRTCLPRGAAFFCRLPPRAASEISPKSAAFYGTSLFQIPWHFFKCVGGQIGMSKNLVLVVDDDPA